MKILVCGGRDYLDYTTMQKVLYVIEYNQALTIVEMDK